LVCDEFDKGRRTTGWKRDQSDWGGEKTGVPHAHRGRGEEEGSHVGTTYRRKLRAARQKGREVYQKGASQGTPKNLGGLNRASWGQTRGIQVSYYEPRKGFSLRRVPKVIEFEGR